MIRKTLLFIVFFNLTACAELQQILSTQTNGAIGNTQIASGLREALDLGIEKQVAKLTQTDGFYKNDLVKIVLPEELQKADKALRNIGLKKIADEGLKLLNRAAEDAVKEATPIFIDAVKQITFTDATTILTGNDNAATQYLTSKTQTVLYDKFNPVISQSLQKVGADDIWKGIINKYNTIPFTRDITPNLTDYVTKEALKGVYTMIAVEEKQIRTDLSSRSTELLKKVFSLQD
jgi:RNA binding exosome subunit